jgi:hypothetical protein
MAAAIIKVRDTADGHLDMDVEFNPKIDNESNAHKLVARFIEFANTPQASGDAEKDTQG